MGVGGHRADLAAAPRRAGRRAFMAAAVAAAAGPFLAGCALRRPAPRAASSSAPTSPASPATTSPAAGPDASGPGPAANPDAARFAALAAAEDALIARYEGAIAAIPDLARELGPILGDHRVHRSAVGALDAAVRPTVGLPAAPTTSPGPTASAPVPSSALAGLLRAETAAARARDAEVGAAVSGDLARLAASIAASETLHADTLRALVAAATVSPPARAHG